MPTLDATKARDEFADTINRAAYGKERVILTRRGRELAAVVPIEDVRLLEELEGRLDLQDARAALAEAVLLEQMLASSAAFLQARGCGALLWDQDTNRLAALTPFAGVDPQRARRLAFPLDGAALAPVIHDRRPLLLDHLTEARPDIEHRGRSHGTGPHFKSRVKARLVLGAVAVQARASGPGGDTSKLSRWRSIAPVAAISRSSRRSRSGCAARKRCHSRSIMRRISSRVSTAFFMLQAPL